ncbi:hypothetical protein LTR36_007618 [Oleoguttula mirabilis]|uniref:Fe2OG dioxygenase domain-containing protein n=1 Tax=Oleoguttula mirabilis TaxID=1507867 RepID=A0AAV9JUC7_9PEZI|nr:hypothetical protein LTR36_007618 [Oleoguttula mirabilis]
MTSNGVDTVPPSGPPPLLTAEQIRHLAFQGWLAIDLPHQLGNALSTLSRSADSFFEQDHAVKRKLYPPSRGTECGFYQVPGEKEYLTLRHGIAGELEEQARQVWHEAALLLHRILCDLTRAGGYNIYAWSHLLENSLDLPKDDSDGDNITSLLRLFRYYPTAGVAEEHVDIGLLTLCIGSAKGLQVRDRSKDKPEWIDAQGPIVLVGDMARTLMRNQVRAGLHRVVGNPQGRSSIVFALRPYLKHPTNLSAFGGEGLIDTKECFDKIRGRKFNINATKNVRERQQKASKKLTHSDSGPREAVVGHG